MPYIRVNVDYIHTPSRESTIMECRPLKVSIKSRTERVNGNIYVSKRGQMDETIFRTTNGDAQKMIFETTR